jgi:hypothetical protein
MSFCAAKLSASSRCTPPLSRDRDTGATATRFPSRTASCSANSRARYMAALLAAYVILANGASRSCRGATSTPRSVASRGSARSASATPSSN